MAQVWAILAWLPLDRLLQLYPALPENLVRARLLLVNKISGPELIRVSEALTFPGSSQTELYIRVCGYQGELCRWSSLYLRPEIVAARAEALGDVPSYIDGILRCETPYGKLARHNKMIRACFLAAKMPYLTAEDVNEGLFDRSFLDFAAWYSESKYCEDVDLRSDYRILGGTSTEIGEMPSENLLCLFIRQRLLHPSLVELDLSPLREEIALFLQADISPEEIVDEAAKLGFVLKIDWEELAVQTPVRKYSKEHFREVWPEALQIIPGNIMLDPQHTLGPVAGPKMVERCHRMLALLAESPRISAPEHYRMALSIICGLPVAEAELRLAPDYIISLMFHIGHPQSRPDLVAGNPWFSVSSDPIRFSYDSEKLIAGPGGYGRRQIPSLLWFLAGDGQLLRLLDQPDIVEALRDPFQENASLTPTMQIRHWHRLFFNVKGLPADDRLKFAQDRTIFTHEDDAKIYQSLFPDMPPDYVQEHLSTFREYQERVQMYFQRLGPKD